MCENANNKISSKSVTMIKAIITETLMKLISAALIRMLVIIMMMTTTQTAIIKNGINDINKKYDTDSYKK